MRVFFAITFSEKTKGKLVEYRDIVANNSIKGRFININNLHLTLEFIGEVREKQLEILIDLLYQLKHLPKILNTNYIGTFKRQNKEIVWLGIEKDQDLFSMQKQLRNLLIGHGFDISMKKYKPHITLGRDVRRIDSSEQISIIPIKIPIHSIALMESKRVNEQLIYQPIEEIIVG